MCSQRHRPEIGKFASMGFALKTEHYPKYTYQDYAQWEGNWELIDGLPYAMSPSPSFRHQRINSEIIAHLTERLNDCKNCKAVLAFDWKINETTVVQPDVSVVCKPVKNNNYLDFAPDLIFEIISPSSVIRDREIKFELYQTEGVKYYVLVDTERDTAEVFELTDNVYKKAFRAHLGEFTFHLEDDCTFDFSFAEIWK